MIVAMSPDRAVTGEALLSIKPAFEIAGDPDCYRQRYTLCT